MIIPNSLKQGDKIGLVAPARKIEMQEIEASISVFESWGLKVELGKNIFAQERQFAGSDHQRAEDLQYMLDNPEIKGIICARGGYGTVRLLPLLNFTQFLKSPKWIVGYSDITALHSHLNQNLNVQSIHGIMPLNFTKDEIENEAMQSLKRALFGDQNTYSFNSHNFNRLGKVEGEIVGGNLSVLYSIAGTNYDINTDGKVLFLEDLDEYLYHIDRMMMNLKFSGKLDNLKAMIVGGMNDMNDNTVPFGKTAYEIILEAVKNYNYPVCFDFPVGHIKNNFAIKLGSKIKLVINENMVEFIN